MLPLLALAVFAGSTLLTWSFARPHSRFHLPDHPNPRSLHSRVVSRSGGLAICGALAAGGLVLPFLTRFDPILPAIGFGFALIGAVSYLDDRRGLNPGVRLVSHALGALALILAGCLLPSVEIGDWRVHLPYAVGAGFSAFYIVWSINLYNFMDGMDGFAAGMTVVGFSTMSLLGWRAGDALFGGFNLLVAAAAGGFLLFNFPPASIFMGDLGSSVLGFLAAVCSLWGSLEGFFPFWAALLVFSPFLVDSTLTLTRRALRGERVWRAHKTHYYQRLVEMGWGHPKTLAWELTLMVLAGLSALAAVRLGNDYAVYVIVAWVVIYAALIAGAEALLRHRAPH